MKIVMNEWAFKTVELITKSLVLQLMVGVALAIILIKVVRWW